MPFKERLKRWLKRAIEAALPEPGQPVKEAALREAYGTTIDADEDQWRKLTGDAQRDLAPLTQARMQKIAHYLWEQNLLGNRLIELPVAFLLAEGVKLQVDDEENQKTLDRFWSDPINDMDLKLPKKARELALFGEQCYPAFVNEHDGFVRIGYLDPCLIQTVVMDPDNPEQPIGVVTVKDKKGNARRYRVIINGDEDVFTKRTQGIRESFKDGDAFFFRVNDLSAGTRGRSDLLAQADWLDAYDQFMFGELERYAVMRSFVWDVTLKNATEQQVKDRASKITTPKPMSVRVHNDSEEWEALAPTLNAVDTSEGARLFRNHVLGGATLPEHWFGGGGDVNRAVGAEMAAPTMKVLQMRQRVLKHMLESIGRYVLFAKARAEKKDVDWSDDSVKVQAIFPELSEKDLSKQTAALSQVAAACASLVTQGLLSEKSAVGLIALIASKLGLEIDAEEELETAKAEAKTRRDEQAEADNFTTPPGVKGDDDKDGAVNEAMQEACDLIRAWQESTAARFAEIERLAAARGQTYGGDERLAEALAAASTENARSIGALVEALGKHAEAGKKIDLDLTLRHGKTRKRVTLADGRVVELEEEDVTSG